MSANQLIGGVIFGERADNAITAIASAFPHDDIAYELDIDGNAQHKDGFLSVTVGGNDLALISTEEIISGLKNVLPTSVRLYGVFTFDNRDSVAFRFIDPNFRKV